MESFFDRKFTTLNNDITFNSAFYNTDGMQKMNLFTFSFSQLSSPGSVASAFLFLECLFL